MLAVIHRLFKVGWLAAYGATFALNLLLATPMQRENGAFNSWRKADGERAAKGRTARPQMPRDPNADNAQ